MPTKNALRAEKFKARRNEIAGLIGDPDVRPYYGGRVEFDIHPVAIDDPDVTSSLYGPEMRATQWTPTSK